MTSMAKSKDSQPCNYIACQAIVYAKFANFFQLQTADFLSTKKTILRTVSIADQVDLLGEYIFISYGPLARYVQLRVAHVPGMPGTFFAPLRVSDPDMHNGTCVTHVPWCMPGSLTSSFLWSRWRENRSLHSRRNPQFYVSCKSPIPPCPHGDEGI